MSRTQRNAQQSQQGMAEGEIVSSSGFLPNVGQTRLERVMQRYSISYDGSRFIYNGYRYEQFADAVAYARLMRDRPWQSNPRGPLMPREQVEAPTDVERKLMASLGIRMEDGRYRFKNYRYDRLVDAANYAALEQRRRREARVPG